MSQATHQSSLSIADLACQMPKAELHVHIEGTLEPELVFKLAQRNGLTLPYPDVAALRAAYHFHDLQSFLDLYYACADVLRTEADFHEMTLAYLQRAHADQVLHTEIFFDPQTHTARGIAFATVLGGIRSALAEARQTLGVSTRLIMCFLRHLSEEDAFATLAEAMPHLAQLDGVGLDSGERGRPPELFERVFAKCRELGLPAVAHAGEEGPPDYIWQALQLLQVQRIDHGVRAAEDPALLEHLAQSGIALTVCPLSNIKLCVFKTMADHNLPALLRAGLKVTVNSDDPAYFGGYMNDNFRAVVLAGNLGAEDCYRLARNSFEASWISGEEKADYLAQLDACFIRSGYSAAIAR